jgi:L-iditol 2-dehydrogenase
MSSMKAALLESIGSIKVRTVDKPKVRPGTLLVKVGACGICGSDLRTFKSGNPRISCPAILGHEFSGEITEVGEGINNFKVGDRIAVGADIPCGECRWCKKGISNNCEKFIAIGYQLPGAFSEYCLLDELVMKNGPVFKIPNQLDYETAALMEPLACCIHGMDLVRMEKGKTVLIIGGGPIGCMIAMLSRHLGAAKVIVSEVSQTRLDLISKIAKPDCSILGTGAQLKERVLKETEGYGADIIFIACPSVEAQEEGIELLAKNGCINFFGGLPQSARKLALQSNKVHYEEISITGSHGSTPQHNKRSIELLSSRKMNFHELVTHAVTLDNIADGFSFLGSQDALKVMVKP